MIFKMLGVEMGLCGTFPAQVTNKAESTIELMLKTPDATIICWRKALNETKAIYCTSR